ncbi:MAG: DUF4159 domain-containing protein [Dehalococcoidia bacterium]|nr:DUF4159 domain-containing protein [Dehalococcoidia bacterium]
MPRLTASDGQTYEVPAEGCLIGRGEPAPGEPLLLDVGGLPGGRTVSRRHARLFQERDRWFLHVELETHNPVTVADRLIAPGESVALGSQAAVRIGDLHLLFDIRAPGEAAPEEQPPAPNAWAPWAPAPQPLTAAAGTGPMQRVNPFRGLMIDEGVWADAHEYHRRQANLHQLAGHGWGIVEGLEVVADAAVPGGFMVRPGVAIDPAGRTIISAEERRVQPGSSAGGMAFVTLQWQEVPGAPQNPGNGQDEFARIIESASISVERTIPAPPAMELARLFLRGFPRNAADPFAPQTGEIDLRYREVLAGRRRMEFIVTQGLLGGEPDAIDSAHQTGLRFMLNEIGNATSLRPRWAGATQLSTIHAGATLCYVTSAGPIAVDGAALDGLRRFLLTGGILWIDCCSSSPSSGFADEARELTSKLGRRLSAIERGHPLLTLRHVFGLPPVIGGPGLDVLEGDGIVVTPGDFGCAWQGGAAGSPLPRETVRSALEVGVNAAVHAFRRQRPFDALTLDG